MIRHWLERRDPPPKCDYQRIKIREEVHVPADRQHRPIITVDARQHEIDTVITKVGKGKAKGESQPKELTGNAEGAGDDFFKAQALLARDDELAEKEALKKTLQQKAEIAAKGWQSWWRRRRCLKQIITRMCRRRSWMY